MQEYVDFLGRQSPYDRLDAENSGGTWTQEAGAADIYPRLRVMAEQT